MTRLVDGLVAPRGVDADTIWAFFIATRAVGLAGLDQSAAADFQVKMLEMWHADNPCYSALSVEVSALGSEPQLAQVDYQHFVAYADRKVSQCLVDQIPMTDPQDFFNRTDEERTERITRWFEAAWQERAADLGELAPSCGDSFFAHVPDAVAAADPEQLILAWNTALSAQVQCLIAAVEVDLRFLVDPAALFEQPEEQVAELISLQTVLAGHLLAIGMGKNYDECWPDFEGQIPGVALARTSNEFSVSQNAALESLAECVQRLPLNNRFAEQ